LAGKERKLCSFEAQGITWLINRVGKPGLRICELISGAHGRGHHK
jgi:hypothetical protein